MSRRLQEALQHDARSKVDELRTGETIDRVPTFTGCASAYGAFKASSLSERRAVMDRMINTFKAGVEFNLAAFCIKEDDTETLFAMVRLAKQYDDCEFYDNLIESINAKCLAPFGGFSQKDAKVITAFVDYAARYDFKLKGELLSFIDEKYLFSEKSIEDVKAYASIMSVVDHDRYAEPAFKLQLKIDYRQALKQLVNELADCSKERSVEISTTLKEAYLDGFASLGIPRDPGYAGRWQGAPMVDRVRVPHLGREDKRLPPIPGRAPGRVSNISQTTLWLAQSRSHLAYAHRTNLTPDAAFDFVEAHMDFHLQNLGLGGTEYKTPYYSNTLEADGYYQPKAYEFAMNMLGDYARSSRHDSNPALRQKLLRMEFELRGDTQKDIRRHKVTYPIGERLKSGEMVSLGSGWDEADGGHAIHFSFKQIQGKTYMIYANRGLRKDGVDPGLHIYEVTKPENLDKARTLQDIIGPDTRRSWLEQQENPNSRGIARRLGLREVTHIEKTDQKTGNCTLAAANHAIQTWLIFDWVEQEVEKDPSLSVTGALIQEGHKATQSAYSEIRSDSKALSAMNVMELIRQDSRVHTDVASVGKVINGILNHLAKKTRPGLSVLDRMSLDDVKQIIHPVMTYLVSVSDVSSRALDVHKNFIRKLVSPRRYLKLLQEVSQQEPALPSDKLEGVQREIERELVRSPYLRPSRAASPSGLTSTSSTLFSMPSREAKCITVFDETWDDEESVSIEDGDALTAELPALEMLDVKFDFEYPVSADMLEAEITTLRSTTGDADDRDFHSIPTLPSTT